MFFVFLLLPLLGFAQSEIDLSPVRNLQDTLPDYEVSDEVKVDYEWEKQNRRFAPTHTTVTMERIQKSQKLTGFIQANRRLVRIKDNKPVILTEAIYTKYYHREDEQGFKYLISHDGSVIYKIASDFVVPVNEELKLYEPPKMYTPAPKKIFVAEYDDKVFLRPEVSFYTGLVSGGYMQDLMNDSEASSGTSNQLGAHLFTQWKVPVKVGLAVHYERANYTLTGGGKLTYHSFSFGPQFKTRDFILGNTPFRLQTQIRVSPFARASAETELGNEDFKFNSTDFLTSIEFPFENRFGSFVLGGFYQMQWLNLKDQSRLVDIEASNKTNNLLGISLSQVFQ